MQFLLLIYHSEAEWTRRSTAEQEAIYLEYRELIQELRESGQHPRPPTRVYGKLCHSARPGWRIRYDRWTICGNEGAVGRLFPCAGEYARRSCGHSRAHTFRTHRRH